MTWLMGEEKAMPQGSPEWHDFRRRHLGASEVPSILGMDDWRKPIDVFNVKLNGEIFKGNFATERGKTLEPIILAKFEDRHRCRLTQPVLEFPEWPTLSASLDGWFSEEGAVVECKAPAAWKHTMALCGLVPDTYQDQLQTQMLVSGSEIAYYVSFHDTQPDEFDYAEVVVRADKKRQNQILEVAKRFWEIVESGVWDETFGN